MLDKILVIAPHPDDEVLGCGGVIHKYSNLGKEVYVLIVTKGSPKLYEQSRIDNVRNEALNAHGLLGVKETFFFDYHAPELDIISQAQISRSIADVIKKLGCDTLFIPHRGDIHSDHKVVFDASLVAGRPTKGNSVKNIFSYETLSETEWAAPFAQDAFIPTHFIDITSNFDKKIEAIKCFKSQVRSFPNSRSLEAIEALAKFRGAIIGICRAEAFMTIRTIED